MGGALEKERGTRGGRNNGKLQISISQRDYRAIKMTETVWKAWKVWKRYCERGTVHKKRQRGRGRVGTGRQGADTVPFSRLPYSSHLILCIGRLASSLVREKSKRKDWNVHGTQKKREEKGDRRAAPSVQYASRSDAFSCYTSHPLLA